MYLLNDICKIAVESLTHRFLNLGIIGNII